MRKNNPKKKQTRRPAEDAKPTAAQNDGTKMKKATNPPYTFQRAPADDVQTLLIWSYVSPTGRQAADSVGIVVHGCAYDLEEAQAFSARLHADWPDFDVHISEAGKWLPVPLPSNVDRLVPKRYDDERLQKIMDNHAKNEWSIKKANDDRMRKLKRDQRDKVRIQQQQNPGGEPRKPLDLEADRALEERYSKPHPLDGVSFASKKVEEDEQGESKGKESDE
jgi:hypothetical protein